MTHRRVFWLLTDMLISVAPAMAQHGPVHPQPGEFQDLDSLRAAVPDLMAEAEVPGLAIAVVDGSGRIIWDEGFGDTARDGGVPVTTEIPFSIQSISKVLTATAVLTAVRDRLVDLDTPIGVYLPELRLQSRFEARPEERITLRHLLAHHAGLPHEASMGNNYDLDTPPFDQHVSSIEDGWLRFPVGQRYSYSNLGFDLAARVLEAVSGAPFTEFVRRAVLDPLELRGTTFDPATILAANDRAIGHVEGFDSVPPITPMLAAGGAYSTAHDLARLAVLHLNRGRLGARQLLPSSLVSLMHAMHRPFARQTQGYGLGIGVTTAGGAAMLNHGGAGFGFSSMMMIDVERGLAVVVLANAQNPGLTTRLAEAALAAVRTPGAAGASAPSGRPPETIDPVETTAPHDSTLAGSYLYDSGGVMYVLWKEGRLGVGTVDDFRPLRFVSDEEAWVDLAGERFWYRFIRDAVGRPAHLIRLYDGSWLDFNGVEGAADTRPPLRWSEYESEWYRSRWGSALEPFKIEIRGGELFLAHLRLEEHLPGLFFTAGGEVLDFRGPIPTWRGIALRRVERGRR